MPFGLRFRKSLDLRHTQLQRPNCLKSRPNKLRRNIFTAGDAICVGWWIKSVTRYCNATHAYGL